MSAYYLARYCSKYYAILTHLFFMQPHKVGIIKPILKMKKHAQKGEYPSFLKYYTIRIKYIYTLSASNLDQETL